MTAATATRRPRPGPDPTQQSRPMTQAMVGGAIVYLIYRWYQNHKQAGQISTATGAAVPTPGVTSDYAALAGQPQPVRLRAPVSGAARPSKSRNGSSRQVEERGARGKVAGLLSEVFKLNPPGLQWGRGVMFLDIALVPLIVLIATGEKQYILSAVFSVLFAGAADPGGSYGYRASHIAVFGLAGAALTAVGFGIATSGWGWLVLAVFAVTLVAGLALRFGLHRFVAGLLLNLWFVVALVLGSNSHHGHVTSHTWAQVLAWVGGTALWIAVTFVGWLIRGRRDRPQPLAELPGDTSARKLTPPLIMFAVLRALGMAGATAIAFGAGLSHADWVPIATIVAMKPSLDQTTVVAAQRLAGVLMGAAAAALLALIAVNESGGKLVSITDALQVLVVIFLMHAAATRFWNYAFYQAAISTAVLLAVDLPHPSNYSAEGDRVLWTLIGVAIAVLVMLLASLLAKLAARKAKAEPQAA